MPSQLPKAFIKLALKTWRSGYKSCKKSTLRLKNWGKNSQKPIKKFIRYCTIETYFLCPKLFKQSWLTTIKIIHSLAILELIKHKNWCPSVISQPRDLDVIFASIKLTTKIQDTYLFGSSTRLLLILFYDIRPTCRSIYSRGHGGGLGLSLQLLEATGLLEVLMTYGL